MISLTGRSSALQSRHRDPELALQQDEVWRMIKTIIEEELTARQRRVGFEGAAAFVDFFSRAS